MLGGGGYLGEETPLQIMPIARLFLFTLCRIGYYTGR